MGIALWLVAGLLSAMYLYAGILKAFHYERAEAQLEWPADLPRPVVTFIGLSELLGAIGLVLPGLTRTFRQRDC
jgi:uncharacterized membrane protein YphA (DoxX/SURF4 family)